MSEPAKQRTERDGTPTWVKVFGVAAVIVVLLAVVLLVTGRGGGHGPGRHTGDGNPPAHTGPPGG